MNFSDAVRSYIDMPPGMRISLARAHPRNWTPEVPSNMNSEDIISFMVDLQPYLEDWLPEEVEKAGVRLPLRDHMDFYDWDGLCYVCLWLAYRRRGILPLILHTRMVLGVGGQWSRMYIEYLESSDATTDAGG